MSGVAPSDLELWLTGFIRSSAAAAGRNVEVGNVEPASLRLPMAKPLIVVRDDPSRLDHTTYAHDVGISVLGWSRENSAPAKELGRWLAGLLFDLQLPLVVGCPIAAVDQTACNGPLSVSEGLDVARVYLTARYMVSGVWS